MWLQYRPRQWQAVAVASESELTFGRSEMWIANSRSGRGGKSATFPAAAAASPPPPPGAAAAAAAASITEAEGGDTDSRSSFRNPVPKVHQTGGCELSSEEVKKWPRDRML